METTNDFTTVVPAKKRPDFLSVICILSFIGCGIAFLGGIYGIIQNTPENMAKNIEQVRAFNPAMADQLEENMIAMQDNVYMQISPYLNFVYLLLSFLGVLMMWKLNKKGFYLYLAGELLPYIPMLVMGKQTMSMMGSMGGGGAQAIGLVVLVCMLVFDIVFIAMYGVNLKHMKQQ